MLFSNRLIAPLQGQATLAVGLGELILQTSTTSEAIQMLSKSREAINCVLVRLSGLVAPSATQTTEPFRFGFCQIVFKVCKARLMVLDRFVYLILAELVCGLFKEKVPCEHAK